MNDINKMIADTDVAEPRYTVFVDGEWLPDMVGTESSDGSNVTYAGRFGSAITNFTLGDNYIYAVRGKNGKWYKGTKYDKTVELTKNNPITGLRIDGDVRYAVHIKGGTWLPASSKGEIAGAGTPIDAIWIVLA